MWHPLWREDGFVSWICLAFRQVHVSDIWHVIENVSTCNIHTSSVRACTGFSKRIISIWRILRYNGNLVTWTVVSLTTAKFKSLILNWSVFYDEVLVWTHCCHMSSLCSHSVDAAIHWTSGARYDVHTVIHLCDRPQWGWLACNQAARYDNWTWGHSHIHVSLDHNLHDYLNSYKTPRNMKMHNSNTFSHRINDENLCYVPELIFREYYLYDPYILYIGLHIWNRRWFMTMRVCCLTTWLCYVVRVQ
jgi:hypothetical protein